MCVINAYVKPFSLLAVLLIIVLTVFLSLRDAAVMSAEPGCMSTYLRRFAKAPHLENTKKVINLYGSSSDPCNHDSSRHVMW